MVVRSRAAARPAAKRRPPARFSLQQVAPSRRSIAVGAVIAFVGAAAYAAALTTSVFAVRTLKIVGGDARVHAELQRALEPELGRSLLRVHAGAVSAISTRIPDVVSVQVDRAFPHTLVVRVTPEQADLVLHQGKTAWLVSTRARVLRRLANPAASPLPRTWVPSSTKVAAGETLKPADGGLAAAALAPLAGKPLPASVRVVRASGKELTLVTAQHFEIRLGAIADLRLKLAVARRILALVGSGAGPSGYLDVSVPQRPVYHAGNARVSGGA